MDDEKQMILEMLAEGKIDAKKAAELIEALEGPAEATPVEATPAEPALEPQTKPATEPPAPPAGTATPVSAIEDMSREFADRIEDIVTQSVNKGAEIASRVTGSAIKGAMAFTERLGNGRLEQKIRRKVDKAMARVARAGRRHGWHQRHTASSQGDEQSDLVTWQSSLEKAYELALSDGREELSETLEEIIDLAAELESEMDEVASHTEEVRSAGEVGDAMDELDEIIEHVSEALAKAHEIEGYLSGLLGMLEFVRAQDVCDATRAVVSTWPHVTAKLDAVLTRATSARSKALAAVKAAVAEIGFAG